MTAPEVTSFTGVNRGERHEPHSRKLCRKCGRTQPRAAFPRKKDGVQAHCRTCRAAYQRAYYKKNGPRLRKQTAEWQAKNRERVMSLAKRNRRKRTVKLREYVWALKGSTPCADCRTLFHPVAMDYDHRPGERKVKSVGLLVQDGVSLPKLRAEIAKCDLVCANCHRVRTYERQIAAAPATDTHGAP